MDGSFCTGVDIYGETDCFSGGENTGFGVSRGYERSCGQEDTIIIIIIIIIIIDSYDAH